MKVAVFTLRSVGVGIAAGVLVAVAIGLLPGTSWGLAAVNGLSAGVLVLTVYVGMIDDRVDWNSGTRRPGRRGTYTLAYCVIFTPGLFVEYFIGFEFVRGGPPVLKGMEFGSLNLYALKMLFLTTGAAAYALGSITAKLVHLYGDESLDPHPLRVTPADEPPRYPQDL